MAVLLCALLPFTFRRHGDHLKQLFDSQAKGSGMFSNQTSCGERLPALCSSMTFGP